MRRSNQDRIVGLDVHPYSFAGAILQGTDPWKARVVSTSTRVALPLLEKWALRHTREEDILVMEASGNAFCVAERCSVWLDHFVITGLGTNAGNPTRAGG